MRLKKLLMRITILIFIIGFCFNGSAQKFSVGGKVVDSSTGEPLAFVNIIINDGKHGGATDIDGKFNLKYPQKIHSLTFSYVGYEKQNITVAHSEHDLLIRLKRTSYNLSEVVIIPGENPAHRIIKKVIDNRKVNDPENISAFSYTSYDKMIFTADMDSVNETELLSDSSFIRLQDFLDERHFFLMESVAKRKFLAPDKSYQKVIANRISGFKDPLFVFLISQLQSFSFYKPMISIFDKNYINPISPGSINKYFFLIEDTTYQDNDTVFIISFRPRKNKNFDGLKGLLYINTHGYAIQNVIAEPARDEEGIGIKIQQQYELINGEKWFPVQLNTDLTFKNINVNSINFIGQGKSYLRDIVLDEDFVKKQFSNIEIDVDPNAHKRPEEYWNDYRVDSLNYKERNTYHFIDSIGEEYKFDRLARTFETLLTGKIPVGFIDIDLNKILRYNDHEGFYLGLGLHTNDRVSRFFKIGGYFGYGFRDKKTKYGGDLQMNLHRNSELAVKFSYMNDLTESGSVTYFDRTESLYSNEMLRQYLVRRMDRTIMKKVDVGFRPFKYLKMNVALSLLNKEPAYNYFFGTTEKNVIVGVEEFNYTELLIGCRYAYGEKFIRNARKKISLGTNYPVVHFQYTRGFDGLLDGEYAYDRFDMRIEKSVYIRYFGKSFVQVNGGYIEGDIPATNLYNGHGSYRKFTVYPPFSFGTMRMNEFLVNKYISLYYFHNFGRLLLRKKWFQPEIHITTNIGFGWMDEPDSHFQVDVKDFDKGYYESGMFLNNIFNLSSYRLGIGFLYRYGPYSFNQSKDNFAWKLSVLLPM